LRRKQTNEDCRDDDSDIEDQALYRWPYMHSGEPL
jgi:hypothetical protein